MFIPGEEIFRMNDLIEVGRNPSQGAQFTSAAVDNFAIRKALRRISFIWVGPVAPCCELAATTLVMTIHRPIGGASALGPRSGHFDANRNRRSDVGINHRLARSSPRLAPSRACCLRDSMPRPGSPRHSTECLWCPHLHRTDRRRRSPRVRRSQLRDRCVLAPY